MKKTIGVLAIYLAAIRLCLGQVNAPLTNDVPITDFGMRMALCDDDIDFTATNIFTQTELHTDETTDWVLHNATTNIFLGVVFIGYTNTFDFKLFDSRGTEVPKTAKGKAMSVGPKSLTHLMKNPGFYYCDAGIREFPKLTDLFAFPADGVYVLEVRYWGWSGTKQRFILSEPIRLRVIKAKDKGGAP